MDWHNKRVEGVLLGKQRQDPHVDVTLWFIFEIPCVVKWTSIGKNVYYQIRIFIGHELCHSMLSIIRL